MLGDVGSHRLDLMSFLSGHRVDAVPADLTTLMPVRRQPVEHVETFSDSDGVETRDRAIQTEDAAGLLRFEGGARGADELRLREPAAPHPRLSAGHAEGVGEWHRAVSAAVARGGPPERPEYPTFADGHEQALIGDAIARSHAERRWAGVQR